jgi:hypothetical protein
VIVPQLAVGRLLKPARSRGSGVKRAAAVYRAALSDQLLLPTHYSPRDRAVRLPA